MSDKSLEKPRQGDFFATCRNCPNGCCTEARPPLTSKRRTIIENFLKEKGITVPNAFENREYSFPRETEGNHCVFLENQTKKCLIQAVKPETCVAGPITFDINMKTGKIEWFLKEDKICSLAGVLRRNPEAFQTHLASAKKELLELVTIIDSESLRAILKIEEPETFKIGEDNLDNEVLSRLRTYGQSCTKTICF